MAIQPYNKAQMGSLPGSDRRYVDQELLKIQTAIQSVENAFGAWTPYTPTVTGGTGTITSWTVNSARYSQVGKLVFVQVDVTITNTGTGGYCVVFSLPFASAPVYYILPGREATLTGKMLQGIVSVASLSVFFYDNTYPGANGNRLVLSGSYESA